MTYTLSSISHAEFYKVNGYLPQERLEHLIEGQLDIDKEDILSSIECYTDEAKCAYPEEDFLSDTLYELNQLSKNLRGHNKLVLNKIIEDLEQIGTDTVNSADYGRRELVSLERSITEKLS